MASSQVNFHYPLLLICLSYIATLGLAHQNHNQGFTIDLIHRDSPFSPLHNPAKTTWEKVGNALGRSISRARHFERATASRDAVESLLVPAGGEYLMNISIGTPPVSLIGIADTGSDLIWTQCQPCVQCYNQSLPIFDPNKSSTFKSVPCKSPDCHKNLASTACGSGGLCSYYYDYGDSSFTIGDLATETVTFGPDTPSFPRVSIGCGHENGGSFNENGSGLVGLGGGGLSLVTQLKSSIGGKFSYCLVPFFKTSSSSKMSFGSDALVSGPGTVSTPLARKDPSTFYYMMLESIGIGDKTLGYKTSNSSKPADFSEEGNIIIDSGTTLTFLPEEFYKDIETILKKEIKGELIQDPEGTLPLCYKSKGEIKVPIIRVRFAGATEIQLKPFNTFIRTQDDIVCFAMVPATDVAIYGNLAQMDFLVGYDIEEGRVSFKPTDCSRLAL